MLKKIEFELNKISPKSISVLKVGFLALQLLEFLYVLYGESKIMVQRGIENAGKHLRWSFLRKQITDLSSQPFIIFVKGSI